MTENEIAQQIVDAAFKIHSTPGTALNTFHECICFLKQLRRQRVVLLKPYKGNEKIATHRWYIAKTACQLSRK